MARPTVSHAGRLQAPVVGCLKVDGVTPLRGARNRRASMAERPAARDRRRGKLGSGKNVLSGAPAVRCIGSSSRMRSAAVSSRSDAGLRFRPAPAVAPPEGSYRMTDVRHQPERPSPRRSRTRPGRRPQNGNCRLGSQGGAPDRRCTRLQAGEDRARAPHPMPRRSCPAPVRPSLRLAERAPRALRLRKFPR